MRITAKHIAIPASILGVVAVALLTGGPRVPMDLADPGAMLASQPQEEIEVMEGSFGVAQEMGAGISMTISAPELFTPSDPTLLSAEGRPQLVTVTVANGGTEPLDLSLFTVVESLMGSQPDQICLDSFDEAAGVVGVPWEPVPPGEEVTFPWVIVCPTTEGDSLTLTVSLSEELQVTFTGSVA